MTTSGIPGQPSHPIPRIIWIMWWQGWDQAPELTRACLRSWQEHNPDWRVVVLDKANIRDHLDTTDLPQLPRADISLQKVANIIRINLLNQHGGVWADATCFCAKPLDEWLSEAAANGFFAFASPTRGRAISNWFIAAGKRHDLVARFATAHNQFWRDNHFDRHDTPVGRGMGELLDRLARWSPRFRQACFSPFVTKRLRIYPYFIFHYHFSLLLQTDPDFRRQWELVPRRSARDCHRVQCAGMYWPPSAETRSFIDAADTPVHKLNWKIEPEREGIDTALNYLVATLGEPKASQNAGSPD